VRILAPALALLLVAGCGDEGPLPEEEVRATVAAFGRATADKDYQALCDRLLAPSLVEDVESIGLPCEVAMRRGLGAVREPRISIGTVRVDGERATADVRTSAAGEEPSQDTLQLLRVGDVWRISSLGEPTAGSGSPG
jgi:predicted small lipoprotein YifL